MTNCEKPSPLIAARKPQIRLLQCLLTAEACPSAIGVHGPPSSGKTTTLKQVLDESGVSYSWVNCEQCPTVRVLLQRALRKVLLETGVGTADDAVAENVDVFCTLVAQMFADSGFTRQHVLVMDRIDRLADSPGELYTCFSRLFELYAIANLTVVFVYSSPEPKPLIASTVPHVYFPVFRQDEAAAIAGSLAPPCTLPIECDVAAQQKFWTDFVRLVITALNPYTGTDIRLILRVARQLWPHFIEGLTSLDINRQYKSKEKLFRTEQFVDRLVSDAQGAASMPLAEKYLLCAAYLASYNPPRYDVRFFSRAKDVRSKRRDTRPKKAVTIPARSLAAPYFDLERMLAIYHSLLPDPDLFVPNTDLGTHISTLCAHGLLLKQQSDPLDSRTKWKINMSWGYIEGLARDIDMPIADYLLE